MSDGGYYGGAPAYYGYAPVYYGGYESAYYPGYYGYRRFVRPAYVYYGRRFYRGYGYAGDLQKGCSKTSVCVTD